MVYDTNLQLFFCVQIENDEHGSLQKGKRNKAKEGLRENVRATRSAGETDRRTRSSTRTSARTRK